MTIELSTITFSGQDDIVPGSGVEQIFNTGIANTFAGNDIISGIVDPYSIPTVLPAEGFPDWWPGRIPGIYNDIGGVIDTGGGNDVITGISQGREGVIPDELDDGWGIINRGTIDTGNGNDIITGIAQNPRGLGGISSEESGGIINTGNGDDTIIGTGPAEGIGISYNTIFDTGKGNDIIVGNGSTGLYNGSATFNTGDGNDTITGNCTSEGYGLYNGGFIDTGDGNDIITGITDLSRINDNILLYAIGNFDNIDTGNGDDIITSVGIFVNDGTINTGKGNDSIITEGGFFSSFSTLGSMFLGNGKDYLKGFGKGNFNGGNGQDTLELTSGSYTVGILGTRVNFTKGNIIMNTSEFETLIAGNLTYNFASLNNGQTIFVP
jgi:hypothetical protein